jgi:hypothetical protein
MIDWKNPTILKLVDQGYRIAAHAYLRPGGRVNYTVFAKHPSTGHVVQGWSRGGPAKEALADLERRAETAL